MKYKELPTRFGLSLLAALLLFVAMPAMAQEDETGDELKKESTAKQKEKKKASKKQRNDDGEDKILTSGLPKDSGWVQCRSDFPKDVPITKVRMKGKGGSFQFESHVIDWDSFTGSKFFVKDPFVGGNLNLGHNKYRNIDIEFDDDIWYEVSFPSYVTFHLGVTSADVQFFVNKSAEEASGRLSDVKVKPLLDIPDTGWVQCRKHLPMDLPITKVRLRYDKEKGSYPEDFSLLPKKSDFEYKYSDSKSGFYSKCIVRTESKSLYIWNRLFNFDDLEQDENGWCEISFPIPVYFFDGELSENIYFYYDADATDIADTLADEHLNLKLAIFKKKIPEGYPNSPSLSQEESDMFVGCKGLDVYYQNLEGYLIGNRLYERDKNNNLFTNKQLVDGLLCPAMESDTIVEVIRYKDLGTYNLKYSNGDSLCLTVNSYCPQPYQCNVIKSCSIHRSGGILNRNRGEEADNYTFTCQNGDKFVGTIFIKVDSIMQPDFDISSYYYEGTLTKADGTVIPYEHGKSKLQLEEEQKQAELKKKREQEEILAVYKEASKKYGEKYVQAAMTGKVIVGMPKELFLKVFGSYPYYVTLDSESRYSQCYRLYKNPDLFSPKFVAWVWISNGRVSKITYN